MGTTLTACAITDSVLHVAHVGDSALYLVQNGRAAKITTDQTVAEAVRASGRVPNPDLEHVLGNCLGGKRDSYQGAAQTCFLLAAGDVLVLATDGLTNYLDLDRLSRTVAEGDFEGLAKRLVAHALYSGGHDNVTVVCVRVS